MSGGGAAPGPTSSSTIEEPPHPRPARPAHRRREQRHTLARARQRHHLEQHGRPRPLRLPRLPDGRAEHRDGAAADEPGLAASRPARTSPIRHTIDTVLRPNMRRRGVKLRPSHPGGCGPAPGPERLRGTPHGEGRFPVGESPQPFGLVTTPSLARRAYSRCLGEVMGRPNTVTATRRTNRDPLPVDVA
jgi:hypothetical protein